VTTQLSSTVSPAASPTAAPSFTFEPLTWNWRSYRIQYTVMGEVSDRPPLLLIHGFGASIGHWRKNMPALAAEGYQVYAIDLLGFGGSEKAPIDYSLELWEELLVEFWQEKIQRPTVFVGNSIGAMLTMMLLAHHPQIAKAGVLLNAAGGLNHRPEELNLPLRLIMGTFSKVVSSPVLGPFLFNAIRQKSRLRQTLKQVYCDRTAITEDLVELLYRPSCDPDAQKVFAAILTAPPGPRPEELLPQIHQPLLVLWGAADPWTPITGSKIYQDLAAEGDRVQFQSIPDTGHCPHDERPDVVNVAIAEWLGRIESLK
jgi:pimeloyl-ACP methyl ester carboxylesterase